MIIVLKESEDDSEARNLVYALKDMVTQQLKKPSFLAQKRQCFVVTQASPERRELFAVAGRLTTALMATTQDSSLATKREYSSQGITMLAWKTMEGDKNVHLVQSASPSSAGRWIRIAEWGTRTRKWRLFEAELTNFGVDPDLLLRGIEAAE